MIFTSVKQQGTFCVPKRYIITFLGFIGYMMLYILRTNLNIAIIAMTSNKTFTDGSRTITEKPEFNWDSKQQGYTLGAFSAGYSFVFVSGFFVQRIGGATMFGLGTALTSVLTILSPFILRLSYIAFICARVVQGLFEGFAVVGTIDTFARWAPPQERARLLSFCYTGAFVGVAFSYQICGIVIEFFWWPAAFYTTGTAALLWSVIWLAYVSDDPQTDKFISEQEKLYLESEIKNISTQKLPVPWKRIFLSPAVYVLLNQFFTAAWVSTFLLHYLPFYIKDVYKVNIKNIGLLSSLPIWFAVIAHPIAGMLADYLRTNIFSVQKVHKIFFFIGELVSGLVLLVAAYSQNFYVSMSCFCLLRVAFSLADVSYWVICVDMAGQFSGVLKSLCHTLFSIGNMLNPIVLGYVVQNHTPEEWNFYFVIASVIAVYGVVTFLLFGSADLQSWAVPPEENIKNKPKSSDHHEHSCVK